MISIPFQGFKETVRVIDKSTISTNSKKKSGFEFQSNIKTVRDEIPIKTNYDDENWLKNYQYARILEDWKKFCDCLSKEDESIFVKMIKSCYDHYYLSINSCCNNKNSENIKDKKAGSCVTKTTSLFMALFLYQQKQLELIKTNL
ncbi:MAG: hypothetical protein L0H55_14760 [Candidatus Nitrosocosmicus sp.]|nr:hypothetical protein [Candidatus Nitrosocosmicus sp.]